MQKNDLDLFCRLSQEMIRLTPVSCQFTRIKEHLAAYLLRLQGEDQRWHLYINSFIDWWHGSIN